MKKAKNPQHLKPVEAELEEHMLTIKLEALKCYGMLKQPNVYDVNDLIHEGIIAFFTAYKKYNPTMKTSFPTFFQRVLINQLNCILIKSYERPSINSESDDEGLKTPNVGVTANTSASICNLILRIKELSEPTKQYLVCCINMPKEAQALIVENSRLKFEVIRKHLGMSWEEGFKARKEITQLLEVAQ